MGKIKEWTLFPAPVLVQAEDEEEAIAKAKTLIQHLLSSNEIEFEDIVDEGEVEAAHTNEVDEDEIIKITETEHKGKEDFDA